MAITRVESLPIANELDVVRARQVVREWAKRLGFSLVDETRIVTAASELARNTVVHGGGGTMQLEHVDNERRGLRLVFEDSGPGIPDVDRALTDGFTTSGGLGMGLGGARRLMNDFEIVSRPGEGTRVTVCKWK